MNKMIFHVHTWRCGHAENVSDEEYIKKAIELGASKITFTDHAPFPGDLFSGRMKMSQLSEYITTLLSLKDKYYNVIDIVIGLELEYLPSYKTYIAQLRNIKDIDILLLGQHHFELSEGLWSFEQEIQNEWKGLIEAQIDGVKTGMFDVIAHPDKVFKSCSNWTNEMSILAQKQIQALIDYNVPAEKNMITKQQKYNYWNEYWSLIPKEHPIIYGADAHFLKDMRICDKENFDCI